jgi:hypothetical protein
VRNEHALQPLVCAEDLKYGLAVARSQCHDLAHLRISDRRRNASRGHVAHGPRLDLGSRDRRSRCPDRSHHDSAGGDVPDIRQLEFHGAIKEATLERMDVAATEPLRHNHRNCGARDRRAK